MLSDRFILNFYFVEKMFKGGEENQNAAEKFFKQQDKNQDGKIDRVSFFPFKSDMLCLF